MSLVYYNCPMLCTQVLNGMERSLKDVPMDIGKQFSVVTVSIDPTERPTLASAKRALYTGLYGRPRATWARVDGDEPQIEQLANAVSPLHYNPASKQFARKRDHDTPEGKISAWNPICDAGSEARSCGHLRGQDWNTSGSDPALLLPCGDLREVQLVDFACAEGGGRSTILVIGLVLPGSQRTLCSAGNKGMISASMGWVFLDVAARLSALAPIPLRPPAASTIAEGVDRLHYTLTAITLFTVVIFSTIFLFHQVPAAIGR